jgi:AcrR family transcriptional regulator
MSDAQHVDGRRQRGEENRARIIQAMLDLILDGDYTPSAEQVAVRAEVSLRTVFRHFEDMDRLYREIASPVEAELRRLAKKPLTADHWQGCILELVDRRSQAFETLAPYWRAANAHRHRSAQLAEYGRQFATALREILKHNLPEQFHKTDLLEALDVLMSIETWLRLRQDQGLSPLRSQQVLKSAVRRLLEIPAANA